MALIDLSATTSGLGGLSGLLAWSAYMGGLLEGEGEINGEVHQTFLMGGQVHGFGHLRDGLLISLGGVLLGSSDLSGHLVVLGSIRSAVQGRGSLRDSVPLRMAGFGTLSAFVEVGPSPQPLCQSDTRQRLEFSSELDGLILKLCDAAGQPFSPGRVTYALYEVIDGQRFLRGSSQRIPSQDGLGRYHVTGTSGGCGQPGVWVIVWSWTNPNGTREEEFILEAGPPISTKCGKYGWD